MKRLIIAFGCGLLFGLGLVVSQMINPAKVISFLDVTGNWDPSLALVMAAALVTTFTGYRWSWKKSKPAMADTFYLPEKTSVDFQLAFGAVLFGIGWGLIGLCPGPAFAALTIGGVKVLVFLASMTVGMLIYHYS